MKLNCVSKQQIMHDLVDCITSCNTKVQKRIKRLELLCILMGIDPKNYIQSLKICAEISTEIDLNSLFEYLLLPKTKSEELTVYLSTDTPNDTLKRLIESELTKKLNTVRGLDTYRFTCGIVNELWERIRKHTIFKELTETRDLLLLYKGGIAQRLVLLHHYPEKYDEINSRFGLGGDNDSSLLLNPTIPNYDEIYGMLIDYVHCFMIEKLGEVSDFIEPIARSVTEIEVLGTELTVTQQDRCNFKIEKGDTCYNILTLTNEKRPIFNSRNESLRFLDEAGRVCCFALLRYKKAFGVGNRVLGAEILDISIPHKEETKAILSFEKYKSGEWMETIFI